MKALDGSAGLVWFTNVSRRSGYVCVHGVATNPNTNVQVESLPACQEVQPYATVNIKMLFAGGDLSAACPQGACALAIKDMP